MPRNPEYSAVVLAVVLGLRTVEMPVTHILIIHGRRASKLVKVASGTTEFTVMHLIDTNFLADYHSMKFWSLFRNKNLVKY